MTPMLIFMFVVVSDSSTNITQMCGKGNEVN